VLCKPGLKHQGGQATIRSTEPGKVVCKQSKATLTECCIVYVTCPPGAQDQLGGEEGGGSRQSSVFGFSQTQYFATKQLFPEKVITCIWLTLSYEVWCCTSWLKLLCDSTEDVLSRTNVGTRSNRSCLATIMQRHIAQILVAPCLSALPA